MRRLLLSIALCQLTAAGPALAEPLRHAFPHAAAAEPLEARFVPPAGARRVPVAERSFGAFLRRLPLLPAGTEVHLFDGRRKPRQDVHAAVADLDVGARDLQQCADAVMRLRAEYLFSLGEPGRIRFHPDPGKPRELAYVGGAAEADRTRFGRYLVRLFSEAGSASLQAELQRVPAGSPPQPGDVLIQGGYPGHAVLILDVAEGEGRRYLLIGQSYMPAQQFHVVRNAGEVGLSPWYDAADLEAAGKGVATPEWRPFLRRDLRRFRD